MHVLTRVVDLVYTSQITCILYSSGGTVDQRDPVKNDLDIWITEIINIEYTFNWTQLVLLCTTGTPPYILILIHARARIQPISGFCFSGLFQLLIGQTIVAFPFPSQMINHPLTTTMPLLF